MCPYAAAGCLAHALFMLQAAVTNHVRTDCWKVQLKCLTITRVAFTLRTACCCFSLWMFRYDCPGFCVTDY